MTDIQQEEPVFITELCDIYWPQWLKCACDHELKHIIVSGTPTDMDTKRAWWVLLSKYYELSGSTDVTGHVDKVKKLEALHAKILQVESLLDVLQTIGSHPQTEELRARLKDWGYKGNERLEIINTLLGNDRLKLKILLKKYEHEKPTGTDTNIPPRQAYLRTLHAIEECKKLVFDRAKLNMEDFAMYIQEIQEQNRKNTPKNKDNGR